jgi:hypothetical protein
MFKFPNDDDVALTFPDGQDPRPSMRARPRQVFYRRLPPGVAQDFLLTNDRRIPAPDHTAFRRSREASNQEIRERVAVTQRITRPGQSLPALEAIRFQIPTRRFGVVPINEVLSELRRQTDDVLVRQLVATVAVIDPASGDVESDGLTLRNRALHPTE